MNGLKENVIVGHKIPAGTGLFHSNNLIVGSQKEMQDKENLQQDLIEESLDTNITA